jgi:hypothetical protein
MASSSSCLSSPDKKRTSGRSVRFPQDEQAIGTVVLEVESCFDFSDEDKKALWFARSDYHFSRSTARVLAKESERYGHSKHLDRVYITAFDQQVQDQLNLWALHGYGRRGLERWANSSHGQSRKDDQYMYIQGVIRAQQEMKLRETFDEERLREVGHILSRKSRLFAQMMGEADAHSAKWEFGIVEARAATAHLSPRQRPRKNLGLVGRKVNRVSDLAAHPATRARRPQVRRVSEATIQASTSPKITIRTRPGRVPRVA